MAHPVFLCLVSCLSCGVLEKNVREHVGKRLEKTSGKMLGTCWKHVGENVGKMLETRPGKCRENAGKLEENVGNMLETRRGICWKHVGENVGEMLGKRRGTCWTNVGEILEKGQDTCCKIVSADVGDLLSQGLEIFL